ncbi:MAG: 1,4-dihydroxy-6-naphthoate synthase [Deltaproteobacteria bacterium]|nr:1,4-dihydroxy-6-naphthoate synthase [Deltaproteobacteria bacterium]
MKLSLAFSPCPNDTFLFHALVKSLIPHPFTLSVTLADIQHLNELALQGTADVCKISFSMLAHLDTYCLLPVGAALGHGNGPKIVAERPFPLASLQDKTIAIPGQGTTAYLLYKLLTPGAGREVFCLYHEIPSLINSGTVDCGLIIHETRFTLDQNKLVEICDLGPMWEEHTKLPIPLGGLVAKRSLGSKTIEKVVSCLQSSLRFAWKNPAASRSYILQHSQEKNWDVVRSHIDLYVNKETESLSLKARNAIELLSRKGGLVKCI